MLLMGYLDRINVANARLAGMQDDLHMSDTMWSAGISLFYVGYIITQLPDTVYLAKGLPRWQMPAYVTAWLYIESSLYRWATSLPQELQVAPSSQPTHSYLANRHNLPARQLYLPYLTSLRVLSRMQPAHSGGSVTATLAVSFVARIFEDFLARDEIKVLAPISTRYCLISSMALVSVMPNKRLWDAVQPDLEILQLALTELSRRWRSAIGASKVLQNAINKRRQRNSSSTATLAIAASGALLASRCPPALWLPKSKFQSLFNPGNDALVTDPFMDPGEALDMGTFQFEHVESWILNDGFLFEP
ncbi:hypothetical protein FOPG_18913 [Fusarium oxysporum f. sp. conglutinans race 2 54008]|uniref:Uncharacterized protein n=1 Tax=Fusarium oxysporum f. sp. conglutinans race 2 54008 TaxID=1089457 RepID=X0HUM3_FUSOX|nr:hypothetical protein FOPG_18913 [Fusarium oxysporum f. sp. conglutinans race 2 54008]